LLLSSDRIKLRPLDGADIRDCFNWNSPETLGEFLNYSPMNWFEFERFVKDVESRPERPLTFLIIEKLDRESIGTQKKKIGIIDFNPIAGSFSTTFEIGYTIQADERKKGYATEAVRLVVEFLFKTKNIERIEAWTHPENIASQKVLEKNGFKKEGTFRKRFFQNGQYRDDCLHALLREEWQQK
jgi:ribosomal-protein-alanine N-acetyltransferase